MLNNYLDSLSSNFKNNIVSIINDNENLKLFLTNCAKLNVNIFENNDIIKRSLFLEKLNSLREVYVKQFGMKIFKKYSKDCNCVENIESSFSKLKQKINIIKFLTEFANKYSDNDFNNIFKKNNISLKIKYSLRPQKIEVLEFDPSLFITSDDFDSDNINSVIYPINNNDKYIEEYSN